MKEPKKVKNIILVLGALALIMSFLTWRSGSIGFASKAFSFVFTPIQKVGNEIFSKLNHSLSFARCTGCWRISL